MKRYQHYGVDAQGACTHAGTHDGRTMSAAIAKRIQRNWEKWLTKYTNENAGEYPLRHVRPTIALVVHELGKPETAVRYTF